MPVAMWTLAIHVRNINEQKGALAVCSLIVRGAVGVVLARLGAGNVPVVQVAKVKEFQRDVEVVCSKEA